MKRVILAVMYASKETAIKPEKKCEALDRIVYITARRILFI